MVQYWSIEFVGELPEFCPRLYDKIWIVSMHG